VRYRASCFVQTGSSLTLFFLLLVVVGGTACGRSGLDDYFVADGGSLDGSDGGPEATVDGSPDGGPSCSARTCPQGCCDGAGNCQPGGDVTACGAAGVSCQDCKAEGFTLCDANHHACGNVVGSCDGTDCASGCCEGGVCFAGTDPNACGTGGQSCQQCASFGLTCGGNHECVKVGCGPENCAGCCFGDQCWPGTDATACGHAGEQCGNCAAQGEACAANGGAPGGSCVGTPGCGPRDCPFGCCDGNGVCQQGVQPYACGAGGSFCQNCQQFGAICQNQQCLPSCGPWNCSQGCCDSSGVCRSGVFDNQCGSFGNSCFDCEQSGNKCLNQQCAPPTQCNAQTCPFGCCDANGLCQPGFAGEQCGNFGNFCQNCLQFGEVCSVQQCVFGGPDGGGCNAQTCPFGCCDFGGNCQPGFLDFQCGDFGNFCQNCQAFGDVCSSQQCEPADAGPPDVGPPDVGPPDVGPPDVSLCPETCSGCCDHTGQCQAGFLDTQCGQFGVSCEDCTALAPASTCDVSVTPRSCASQQMFCPSPYGGCDPLLQESVPVKEPSACSSTDLQNAAAACAAGAHSAGCNSFFQYEFMANPTCATCLQPFDFDFAEGSGVVECAAPYVDSTCNHNSACLIECAGQSCNSCPDPNSTAQCRSQVTTGSGQCSTFYQGLSCVTQALGGSASFCSPSTYQGNFGPWLQGVGAQYCGP